MLEQALAFRDESESLFALLDALDASDWTRETQFKHWTPNDIVAHLHMGNYAADLSLKRQACSMRCACERPTGLELVF
jgi:hypothetical protein